MPAPGFYDGLNDEPVNLPCTMHALAAIVHNENYGAHRFITELIRVRDAHYNSEWTTEVYEDHRRHTQMLRELLEKGFY